LDLALGYRAIFFSMWKYKDPWLVINPNIFAEIASHNWVTFKLAFMDIRVNFDFIGYKATPIEYQGMWNLNRTD